MAAASSSSSSFTANLQAGTPKYDVFLSFRGEDTRNNFTSFLYDALCRKHIETFIDNNEVRKGDEISSSLTSAIQNSSLSIIVFSQDYASSSWCLNELLEILECNKTKGQIILPVFYHVNPSDVRKQTGSYGQAFAKHEKRFKKFKDKITNWRAALTQVASLSGWDLNQNHGSESEFVDNIVKDVLKRLNHLLSCDHLDGLIGIASRIERIESLLCIGEEGFRIIGIWGMGGIGKTTIARAIFNRNANQFEACCFLENVSVSSKYGPNNLEEKLLFEILDDQNVRINSFTLRRLRRKKILIVLDDVDDSDHFEFLVKGHKSFNPKSRIIITSRDKQVLKNDVDELYELKELDYHEALQLFSSRAFKQNQPSEDYMEMSNKIIYYANGNPLALKVLGSFLLGLSKVEWKSLLNKLKRSPDLKIQNVLRISYDGLDHLEKEIFLYIACFFKGDDKERVIAILDGCGLFADIGIRILVDKCLLTITKNKLDMHDLIQEMGRSIVIQESTKEVGERSRLWDPQDIHNLFKRNTGTKAVESISLDLSRIRELHLSPDGFKNMHRLKFLKFYSSHYDRGYAEEDQILLSQGLELLPNELRYLHWHRYPLNSLPSNFDPKHLFELEMHHSNIDHLWKETKPLENLRRIDLSYSQHLTEVPNLSHASNLQIMVLKGCSSLINFPMISWNITKLQLSHTGIEEIPSTIKFLNKLVSLRLDSCTRLKNLPKSICYLTSLEELNLNGCSSITEFPETSRSVKYLNLDGIAIEEVPSTIKGLTNLNQLNLGNCTRLKRVSSGIFELELLRSLSLSGCSKLDHLPEVLENKGNLRMLFLLGTAIKELPSSIELLPRLSHLYIGYCKNMESLPSNIYNLSSLSTLDLSGWPRVNTMLENLHLSSLSSIASLTVLNLSECDLLVLPSALSCISSLETLNLSRNNFESLSLIPFSSLKYLDISYCMKLQSLQEFPSPLRLVELQAHQCISLKSLPASNAVFAGRWSRVQRFAYSNCFKLDDNAHASISEDARLRIQFMAINARQTASMEDYPQEEGAPITFCFWGNEIPEWIRDQNEGYSITIDLPPRWCTNKLLGFVVCFVATFEDGNFHGDHLSPFDDPNYFGFFLECKCNFINDEGEWHETVYNLENLPIGRPESNHVFLVYAHRLLYDEVQENHGDCSFSTYASCKKAFFQFSLLDNELWPLPCCEVTKCGVHLLYSDDQEIAESFNGYGHEVESGRDGISNDEEEHPNFEKLEDVIGTESVTEDNRLCNCSFGDCFSFLFQRLGAETVARAGGI